jgi:hypothetical protein
VSRRQSFPSPRERGEGWGEGLKFLEDGIENASEIVHYIIVADAIDAVSHAIERRCAREIQGDFLITPMRRAVDFDD